MSEVRGRCSLCWTTSRARVTAEAATFLNNSAPELTAFNQYDHPTFTLMFVLVFPGFTGVLAGSNLSGHLLAPTRSIAQGTLASLVFVVATYCAICLTLAATVQVPLPCRAVPTACLPCPARHRRAAAWLT